MKHLPFTCLIFFFLPTIGNLFAQTDSLKIDSLKKALVNAKEDSNQVNALNQLSKILFDKGYNDSDEINEVQYTDKALLLAEKLNYKKGQSDSYYRKARLRGNLEERLAFLNLSISFAKESKDSSAIFWSYFRKADMCRSEENYAEALSSYLDALKIGGLIRYKYGMASSYQEIAAVYLSLGNTEEVLKNFKNALELFDDLKAFEDIASCYLGIGQYYFNKGEYNAALDNLNRGLDNIEKAGFNVTPGFDFKGWILLNIGMCYEMLVTTGITGINSSKVYAEKQYAKAEYNYRSAEVFAVKDRNLFLGGEVYTNIGSLYLKTNRVMASKPYLDSALIVFQQLKSKNGLQKIYFKYSLYDSAIGNYKKAYEDHKLYMQYFKEIQSDSSIQKTTQLQSQYNFEKKETLAKAVQEKKDEESERIKNKQYFAIAALGVVVFAVLIIALIQFKNNKQKQKTNLLITQQKEKVENTLSDLKSTQAQLIQSEKMASLGELTAGIAHEIQNPLNFVNNFSEVSNELIQEIQEERHKADGTRDEQLQDEILNDIKHNLEKINHHGKRADAIVKGMLQHSRSSTGAKQPTDINKVADDYLRLAFHGLRAKDKDFNATLKTDFDNSIGKINIIPQDVGRVLLNLYNNAFYAVAERRKAEAVGYEPTVSVITKRSLSFGEGRGEDLIKVIDNGNGIPQKIVDKIFQPFFTTKPTGQGTGLGLSLAYDIIKAHGGEIKVETKEGEGTSFSIQLPTNA